jgi:hypothetical protein
MLVSGDSWMPVESDTRRVLPCASYTERLCVYAGSHRRLMRFRSTPTPAACICCTPFTHPAAPRGAAMHIQLYVSICMYVRILTLFTQPPHEGQPSRSARAASAPAPPFQSGGGDWSRFYMGAHASAALTHSYSLTYSHPVSACVCGTHALLLTHLQSLSECTHLRHSRTPTHSLTVTQ